MILAYFLLYIILTHYLFHILNVDIIKNNVNIECEIMDVICKYEVYIKECKKTITEYDNI